MTAGLENYTVEHYTEGGYDEAVSYRAGKVREDQVAALGYILGHYVYRGGGDLSFVGACGRYAGMDDREPGFILSIGSGRGELEAIFASKFWTYLATDPSPGAAVLTPKTIREWAHRTPVFAQARLGQVAKFGLNPDTIVFGESIEHIHEKEWDAAWPWMKSTGALLVITNQINYHPIGADSDWNHVRTIDDDVYDKIASEGETMFRQGSHLVVQL